MGKTIESVIATCERRKTDEVQTSRGVGHARVSPLHSFTAQVTFVL